MNNAILTIDYMIRRKWQGFPACYFCNKNESIQHLLFQCSTSKAVWDIVAHAIGAKSILKSRRQCWPWYERWLPAGQQFHTLGIAVVCWVIWKTCNSICFEGEVVTNPATIVCYACVLMGYWAGLFLGVDKEALEAGVKQTLAVAMSLTTQKKTKQDTPQLKDGHNDDQ
jgi:hypothetical protein